MPLSLLTGSPFHDFLVPGLVLFTVLGLVPCLLVVALLAKINVQLQQGFRNPIDVAILTFEPTDVAAYPRVDEVPYDFLRKRFILLTELDGQLVMSTKGALQNVLDVC